MTSDPQLTNLSLRVEAAEAGSRDLLAALQEALVKARSQSTLLGQSDATGQLNDKYDRAEQAAWAAVDIALAALGAEREGLREALAPFAAIGEQYEKWSASNLGKLLPLTDEDTAMGVRTVDGLTVGHFRAARRALGETDHAE